MTSSFAGLGIGRCVDCLVYLLIVVNFQSWLDPFIIITPFLEPWRELSGCYAHATLP